MSESRVSQLRERHSIAGRAHHEAMIELISAFGQMDHRTTPIQVRAARAHAICLKHVRRLGAEDNSCDPVLMAMSGASAANGDRAASIEASSIVGADPDFSSTFWSLVDDLVMAEEVALNGMHYKSMVYDVQNNALLVLPYAELEPFFEVSQSNLASAEDWYGTTWADVGVDPPPTVLPSIAAAGSASVLMGEDGQLMVLAVAFPWKRMLGADAAGAVSGAVYGLVFGGPTPAWGAYVGGRAIGYSTAELVATLADL